MVDSEKVIKGLHCCAHTDGINCIHCPYDIKGEDCTAQMSMDVLALLKEQEAIESMNFGGKTDIMANLEGLTWDDWHMYHSDTEVQHIAKSVFDLLIALLKEQKPVKQNDGSCPNCGWNFENGDLDFSKLDSQKFYCPNCGKAVKWE